MLRHRLHAMTDNRQFPTLTDTFNDAIWMGMPESGSKEWHELRSGGIGGSEIGTIMGLNPFESAFGLWAKRTGQIPDPPIDNWSVRFGKAFEEPILKMWQTENPDWEVFLTGTWRHGKFPYLQANPDALAKHRKTGEWIVVEVKTSRAFWDGVPPAYRCQVLHYMDVLHLDRGVIVGVAGWNWEEHFIDRDDFEIETQRMHATRFWEHLEKHVQPAWDGSKATYEAQRQMNPNIVDEEVELGVLGEQLIQAQLAFEDAERDVLQLKSEVLHRMGAAKHGLVDGERVVSRQARGNGTPWLVIRKGKTNA